MMTITFFWFITSFPFCTLTTKTKRYSAEIKTQPNRQ